MAPEDTRPPLSPAVTLPAGSGVTDPSHAKAAGAALVLGALGVVFGDIGTSPLYTLRESFTPGSGMTPTPRHVLGVLSILFWAVTLTVTIKYVTLIMRADNKGEGGVLALATLVTQGLNGRGGAGRRGRPRLRLPGQIWRQRVLCKCCCCIGFGDPVAFLGARA